MKTGDVLFEVIVGTYEEFVLGFQFTSHEDGSKELLHTFATHSHRASVRSVACGGKLVVSGGADETINIYNMVTRKECGMLMEHNGTITSLNFTPDCSHLISTSEDGTIKVFRQGSWQLEKVWHNAHKGTAVTCLSVHPSGKMALSVGKDHTLRTWNLVKGRPAYTTNLFSRCRQLEMVLWSPGGQLFAIPMDCQLELSSTDKAGILNTLKLPTKVTACVFLSDEVVCVGEASGDVNAYCTEAAKQLWRIPGNQRVRGLVFLHNYLVSATSTGSVSVHSVEDVNIQPQKVASTDSGCRITCLTIFDYGSEFKVKKETSDKKTTDISIETHSKKSKQKNKTKCKLDNFESRGQAVETTTAKVGNNVPLKGFKGEVSHGKFTELKSDKSVLNSKKTLQTNSFIEIDSSVITEIKNKKRSGFKEEYKKSAKKQKVSLENTNAGNIIFSPHAQTWVVEDSKR